MSPASRGTTPSSSRAGRRKPSFNEQSRFHHQHEDDPPRGPPLEATDQETRRAPDRDRAGSPAGDQAAPPTSEASVAEDDPIGAPERAINALPDPPDWESILAAQVAGQE
jgi:hypothetical protein